MRLNQYHKQAFVKSVMDDIPKVDYSEEMRNAVQNYAVEKLPSEIKKIWNSNQLRGFLKVGQGYFGALSVCFPMWSGSERNDSKEISSSEKVQELALQNESQNHTLQEARRKISMAIESVSTVKKAKELFPEFEKYLPNESDPPSKFAPAIIANLSADLTALGWPKDKQTIKKGSKQ